MRDASNPFFDFEIAVRTASRLSPRFWTTRMQAIGQPWRCECLSRPEAAFLAFGTKVRYDQKQIPDAAASAIMERLEAHFQEGDDGLFVRSGTCSAKDSPVHIALKGRFTSAHSVLIAFQGSARLHRHLRCLEASDITVEILTTPWQEIDPLTELRVFVADRRIVGASQYSTDLFSPVLFSARHKIAAALCGGVGKVLCQESPLPDFCADVRLKSENGQLVLCELNPFGPASDGLLYCWEGVGDFDHALRLCTEDGAGYLTFPLEA